MADDMISSLHETIKTAAIAAVNDTSPTAVLYGTVESVSPLKILVEQKMHLGASSLLLSSLVRDITVDVSLDTETETEDGHTHGYGGTTGQASSHSHPYDGATAATGHSHAYKGTKSMTLRFGLKEGEKVMLLRVQGGQKFIVLDRVR